MKAFTARLLERNV